MANVQHASLTDPELHEPKGVASASSGQVYVADGAGSGSWQAQSSGTLRTEVSLQADTISDSSNLSAGTIATITFTPASASNRLRITIPGWFGGSWGGGNSANGENYIAVRKNGTEVAKIYSYYYLRSSGTVTRETVQQSNYIDVLAGGTSSQTWTLHLTKNLNDLSISSDSAYFEILEYTP